MTEKATDGVRRGLHVTITAVLTVTATVALRFGGELSRDGGGGSAADASGSQSAPAVVISAQVSTRGLEVIVDWCGSAPLVPTSRHVMVDDVPVSLVDWRSADAHGSCKAAAVSQVRLESEYLPPGGGPMVIRAGICDGRGQCGRAEIVRFVRARTGAQHRNR